jgi:glycosyltransferase involved in cell wall biosynthesis
MLHNILKRKFKNDYTQALACSELAGDWIFGKHQFQVLNNGINVRKYRFDEETRSQKRKQLGLDNCFVLGHIGLFNEQKNHSKVFDVFLELRNMVPQAKLLCVSGNSSVPEEIIQDVQERGINEDVVFLTSRNDVPELLMAMDYFILPSKWEGLGIAAIEAQASGLHCVVSENVPADIDLTDGVKHIPLQKNAKEWAEYIAEDAKDMYGEFEKCICGRIGYNEILQNSPYNIENSKLLLKQIYTGKV